ncbi:MAG: methionine--tRNA ligase [Candidatus Hadarchaeia archaeon]
MSNDEEYERVMITSALPYIHGIPHLGNVVTSVLPADVYYRFQRLKGEEVIYICGSDSHGTMYEVEAEKRGIDTSDLVYENHERIKDLFEKLNLDFSYYGITDSDENREVTYRIFRNLDENGYIKEKKIELPYCRNCNQFLADRWIEGECPVCGGLARGDQCDDCGTLLSPEEIVDPYCVHCGERQIDFRQSSHLFFQLQEFEDWLKRWIKGKAGNTLTESETFSWLDEGLEERCISRDSKWGFRIPKEGYEDKVFYVWVDAPIGYIGATVNWAKERDLDWEDWWFSDEDTKYVQFMGKDNIPFHTIIFPSMLKGTGEEWTLADKIMAGGFLLSEDVKFSKSRGKGLNLESAFDMRSSEYWRYVLMSLYPRNSDTTFSWELFRDRINNELTDSFGNYIHRVLKFVWANFDGRIPDANLDSDDKEFLQKVEDIIGSIEDSIELFRFKEALTNIVRISSMGNQFFQEREPWNTIDSDPDQCKRTMAVCSNIVKSLAIISEPFLPSVSERIWNFLRMDSDIHEEDWERSKEFEMGGIEINQPTTLFEKIREEELSEFEKEESEVEEGGESMISFEEFQELDMRVGEIKKVVPIEDADKLYKLEIDVGDEIKQSVAGLKEYYSVEDLEGRNVVVLVNLEPSELMGVKSECMVLAAVEDEEPVLLSPLREVEVGSPIE